MSQVRTKRQEKLVRLHYTLDQASMSNLKSLRRFYAAQLGREVSTSLIIRRALQQMVSHLGQIETGAAAERELLDVLRLAG